MQRGGWGTFLESIDAAKADLGFLDGEECFFRGMPNADTASLLPSLFYLARDKSVTKQGRATYVPWKKEKIQTVEADLFFEFRMRARGLLPGAPEDDWDVLFRMRHHAVPTRIMDWTESFAVALYFAVHNHHGDVPACMWVLNPYKLNEHKKSYGMRELITPEYILSHLGDDHTLGGHFDQGCEFDFDFPVAVYPPHGNPRLRSQAGYFTLHGDKYQPLETLYPGCVRKILLPAPMIEQAWVFLDQAGVNEASLFPDFDGLGRFLTKKYRLA